MSNKSSNNQYNEYQSPHIVWYAITHQMTNIKEQLLILLAYVDNIHNFSNNTVLLSFWNTTISSVLETVIMAYARLFDNSSLRDKENCSIAQLNNLIKNDKRLSDNKRLLLQEKFAIFENTNANIKKIIHDYRCKRFAHNDLEIMFYQCGDDLTLDALCDLYSSIMDLMRFCGQHLIGATCKITDIYNERTKYSIVFETMLKPYTEE